jgi:subtilisin family serine protease
MSVAKWGKDDLNCGYTNDDVLHQAICRVVASGVTVAVAAGNDSGSAAARVPAAYNEVITVSALADTDGKAGGRGGPRCFSWGTYDHDDTFADFSNLGSDVDIIAPGKCIWSTMPGNRYAYMSGTSMATPAVAGAIALYRASRPWVSPGMVKGALQFLGTYGYYTSTDPDGNPEKLLDVSRMGPGGDYTINMNAPLPLGEAGGTVAIPVRIERTPTHFETIELSATTPPGFPVVLDRFSVTGWTAESALVTVTVPPSTPAGSYPVTVVGREGSRSRSDTVNVVVENDPPTAFAPSAAPAYKVSLGGTTAPLRIQWAKATDAASAIAAYELQYSLDYGAWTPAGTLAGSATETVRQVALSHNHRFRIRARDAAGNWSAWVESVPLGLGVVDDSSTSMRWSSGWFRYTTSAAYAGTTRYSMSRGAWMRVSKTAKILAFVAPVGPTRGSASIYVNGVYQATVSLYSSTSAGRRVLWVKDFGVDGAKTIEIRVAGTSGRPRVDVDAILVGR